MLTVFSLLKQFHRGKTKMGKMEALSNRRATVAIANVVLVRKCFGLEVS